jgi:hypothetical protein
MVFTKVIDELKRQLKLEDQGDVAAYLGIDVASSHVDGRDQFKMTQPHLIQQIIKAVSLKDYRLHDTPAEPGRPLGKDTEGEQCFYNVLLLVLQECNWNVKLFIWNKTRYLIFCSSMCLLLF